MFIRDEISDDRVEEVHLEAALPALLITAIIIIMTIQPIIIGIKTDSREGRSISELMRVFAAYPLIAPAVKSGNAEKIRTVSIAIIKAFFFIIYSSSSMCRK